MNKQELIDYCNAIKENKSQIINCIDVNEIIKKIEQLDEPQKITIPQVVADWIEWTKKDGLDLQDAMNLIAGEQNEKLLRWFYHENKQETFARAWLDGYEVEKEKRYLVKIVGMDNINGYLSYNKKLKKWFFGIASESRPYRLKHTRKELEEDGFGWVLDCPGVEVEEVEE
nr:MAG TPA: Protein of unknown function (DUF1642) [Caudoviricetes sp.]